MELRLENLRKSFKDTLAVDNPTTLTLTAGVWGLLGANGAGKTTLIKMIVDIISPTKGTIYYNNIDIQQMKSNYREILGFLPQDFVCSSSLTVNDFLEYVAACKGLSAKESKKKIDSLLDVLTLSSKKHKKVMSLSGGMRRRVGIAQAVLNDPKILILDEPTAGLDPGERIKFRKFISEFARECIVLISTHIVSDIESISTKNIIFKEGRSIRVGTTDELIKEIYGKVWEATILLTDIYEYEDKLRIVNQKSEGKNKILIRYLAEEKLINNSSQVEASLEDLYLWLFPAIQKEVI